MNVTFLVTINLDDLTDLSGVAEEITDDLGNFEVVSVAPWARPTLSQNVPIQTTQPTIQPIQTET
jgi:hypothetical protein